MVGVIIRSQTVRTLLFLVTPVHLNFVPSGKTELSKDSTSNGDSRLVETTELRRMPLMTFVDSIFLVPSQINGASRFDLAFKSLKSASFCSASFFNDPDSVGLLFGFVVVLTSVFLETVLIKAAFVEKEINNIKNIFI